MLAQCDTAPSVHCTTCEAEALRSRLYCSPRMASLLMTWQATRYTSPMSPSRRSLGLALYLCWQQSSLSDTWGPWRTDSWECPCTYIASHRACQTTGAHGEQTLSSVAQMTVVWQSSMCMRWHHARSFAALSNTGATCPAYLPVPPVICCHAAQCAHKHHIPIYTAGSTILLHLWHGVKPGCC